MADQENFEEDLFADLYVHLRLADLFLHAKAPICACQPQYSFQHTQAHRPKLRRQSSTVILTHLIRYTEDDATAKQDPAPEVKIEPTPAVVMKTEEPTAPVETPNADGQAQVDDQDADDDIDFNLGNGNSYSTPANQQDAHGPGIKEDG